MKKIIILSFLILIINLVGCGVDRYETSVTTGTVVEKQFSEGYTTLSTMYVGNTLQVIPISHPCEYTVKIKVGEITEVIEDPTLYKDVKEGDTIQVLKKVGFDDKGNVVKIKIEPINRR